MKKLLIPFLAAVLAVSCFTFVSGAEEDESTDHLHESEGEWQISSTSHWKLCKICGEDTARSMHTFLDWEITLEPTCRDEGEQKHTCSVCGYTETEKLGKTADHTFGEWKEIKKATDTEEGAKERFCSVCGLREEAAIPVTGHDHTPKDGWERNLESHWKICECGEILEKGSHSFVNGTCTICGISITYESESESGNTSSPALDTEPSTATKPDTENPPQGSTPTTDTESGFSEKTNVIMLCTLMVVVSAAAILFFILNGRKKRSKTL